MKAVATPEGSFLFCFSNHTVNYSKEKYRWVSRRLRHPAKESTSLSVCGSAFQNLGEELEKDSETKPFFSVILSNALGPWEWRKINCA